MAVGNRDYCLMLLHVVYMCTEQDLGNHCVLLSLYLIPRTVHKLLPKFRLHLQHFIFFLKMPSNSTFPVESPSRLFVDSHRKAVASAGS